MTIADDLAHVDLLASGRTRMEGVPLPLDERLAAEVKRLRSFLVDSERANVTSFNRLMRLSIERNEYKAALEASDPRRAIELAEKFAEK